MDRDSKIVVFGASGLVGSAIARELLKNGYTNIVGTYKTNFPNLVGVDLVRLDCTNQLDVKNFFEIQRPEYIFLAAAKVGGIIANNKYRADFIFDNLSVQNNVIHFAYKYSVKKLLFLGSTCIYPKNCPQPMKEEYLLTGELEYTNEPYAIAKIAGIKMCESYNLQYGTNFISVMPTNLYGPNDNFDLEKSHVLPALLRKIYLGSLLEHADWEGVRRDLNKNPIEGIDGSASLEEILKIFEKYGIKIKNSNYTSQQNNVEIEIWGTGKPRREFLWVEDMAEACIFLMEYIDFQDIIKKKLNAQHSMYNATEKIRNTHINIGSGKDISIKELALIIKEIVGFKGEFYFNTDKPDGTMIKLTDVTKLNSLGWRYRVELEEGIKRLLEWYVCF